MYSFLIRGVGFGEIKAQAAQEEQRGEGEGNGERRVFFWVEPCSPPVLREVGLEHCTSPGRLESPGPVLPVGRARTEYE